MMATKSKPARLLLTAGLTLACLAGVAAGVLYFRLHADVEINSRRPPNSVDGHEALYKITMFNRALDEGRKGHIRLTETEINSRALARHVLQHEENESENELTLKKCRVKIPAADLTLVALWLEGEMFGKHRSLVWTRLYRLNPAAEEAPFKLIDMRLGKVPLPEGLWDECTAELGDVDERFAESIQWIARVPRVELHAGDEDTEAYAKLFTFKRGAGPIKTAADAPQP